MSAPDRIEILTDAVTALKEAIESQKQTIERLQRGAPPATPTDADLARAALAFYRARQAAIGTADPSPEWWAFDRSRSLFYAACEAVVQGRPPATGAEELRQLLLALGACDWSGDGYGPDRGQLEAVGQAFVAYEAAVHA